MSSGSGISFGSARINFTAMWTVAWSIGAASSPSQPVSAHSFARETICEMITLFSPNSTYDRSADSWLVSFLFNLMFLKELSAELWILLIRKASRVVFSDTARLNREAWHSEYCFHDRLMQKRTVRCTLGCANRSNAIMSASESRCRVVRIRPTGPAIVSCCAQVRCRTSWKTSRARPEARSMR